RQAHSRLPPDLKKLLVLVVILGIAGGLGWWYLRPRSLPDYGPLYREYAYVTNGKSDTVSVIDLTPRPLPRFNVINTGSNNVSVIDAERNQVVATIGVQGKPYFIDVAPDGARGYVANSGSANVSVIDLEHHKIVANVRVGGSPGLARVSPDGK